MSYIKEEFSSKNLKQKTIKTKFFRIPIKVPRTPAITRHLKAVLTARKICEQIDKSITQEELKHLNKRPANGYFHSLQDKINLRKNLYSPLHKMDKKLNKKFDILKLQEQKLRKAIFKEWQKNQIKSNDNKVLSI